VGEISQFDGSASFDPDGTIVSYQWDFGDGSSGSTAVLSHSYALPGTYTVILFVTDDGGLVGIDAVIVTVQN
jgi:serine protease